MMLDIDNLHVYYGDSHVLHGTSLEVDSGQVVALLGRNGMGKTTLVKSVMGLLKARMGQIKFDGDDITGLPPEVIARKGIGLVPQGRFIFPSLSVYENLMVVARNQQSKDSWNVDRVFEEFPKLRERAGNRGNQLSGGEQQMLAIGRALVTNPRFLIMDEPTEGLAPTIVQEVGALVRSIKQRGYTILLVEQNLKFALDHADMVCIMAKGQIVFNGSSQELRENEILKKEHLGV